MNIIVGEEIFRKNAGVIAKPSDYEFHWLCEYKDKTQLSMFDSSNLASNKRSFDLVRQNPSNISHIIWKSLHGDFHFGVNFNSRIPTFMLNSQLYVPIDPKFYNGTNFIPHFFIRNLMPIECGLGRPSIIDSEKEMIYFAGYHFTVKDQTYGMYISFNGKKLSCEGFTSFEICGGYKLY